MRTEQLYCFLEAARCGSFTKAAENLYIKQPSLREAVNNLEAEIGAKLFLTTNKGCRLTTYGKQCLPIFQRMIQMYESIKLENQVAPGNILTIGLDFYADYCRQQASKKHDAHDHYLIAPTQNYIIYQDTPLLLEKLVNNGLDMVCFLAAQEIAGAAPVLLAQIEHDVIRQTIFPVPISIVVSKNHPLATKRNITLADFKPYLLLTSSEMQYPLTQYAKSMGVDLAFYVSAVDKQTNQIFFNDALSFVDDTAEKEINYAIRPNIRKINLSSLFRFELCICYRKDTPYKTRIDQFTLMMHALKNTEG